jgi:kumamolisin
MQRDEMFTLDGSNRTVAPSAEFTKFPDPDYPREITIRVAPKQKIPPADRYAWGGPLRRLTQAEFSEQYGATDNTLDAVRTWAERHGFDVFSASSAKRLVRLRGKVRQVNEAMGTKLGSYEFQRGDLLGKRYVGREGKLMVSEAIQDDVEAAFGTDERPLTRHFAAPSVWPAGNSRGGPGLYLPTDMASIYNFPTYPYWGRGQTIAILEFGARHLKRDSPYPTDDDDAYFTADGARHFNGDGYPSGDRYGRRARYSGGFFDSDILNYFRENLKLQRPPRIRSVSVDGVYNAPDPFQINKLDAAVTLDIAMAAALAPEAEIVVYFAPDTECGWLLALCDAIHNPDYKPSIISISCGWPEGPTAEGSYWTEAGMLQIDQELRVAAMLGITVCVASGNDGSEGYVPDGFPHVVFPASSPSVLSCGGTTLTPGECPPEVVWNKGAYDFSFSPFDGASGGGFSSFFRRPRYQRRLPYTNSYRGIPDVAANADFTTGYRVEIHEVERRFLGGTSASAPLWAGLIARINNALGCDVGFINPALYYGVGAKAFNDITVGNNDVSGLGVYDARPGWDSCTGWGTPNGCELLEALRHFGLEETYWAHRGQNGDSGDEGN